MTTTTKTQTTPVYVSFCAALVERCAELGLPKPVYAPTETGLPQNAGFAFLRLSADGAAIIIPKSVTRMGRIDLHVDASDLPGYIPLTKPNGKVICQFAPDVDLLASVLPRLVGASKRPTRAPQGKTVAAPVATPGYTSEEIEAELALIEGRSH